MDSTLIEQLWWQAERETVHPSQKAVARRFAALVAGESAWIADQWTSASHIQLMAGEMSAKELLVAKIVAKAIGTTIRAKFCKPTTTGADHG